MGRDNDVQRQRFATLGNILTIATQNVKVTLDNLGNAFHLCAFESSLSLDNEYLVAHATRSIAGHSAATQRYKAHRNFDVIPSVVRRYYSAQPKVHQRRRSLIPPPKVICDQRLPAICISVYPRQQGTRHHVAHSTWININPTVSPSRHARAEWQSRRRFTRQFRSEWERCE